MSFSLFSAKSSCMLWDENPIRAPLFGNEYIGKFAQNLAKQHHLSSSKSHAPCLYRRLKQNERIIKQIVDDSKDQKKPLDEIPQGLDWLLDNFHIVDAQIWQTPIDLPKINYSFLPSLSSGKFKGYARVFAIAWTYLEHSEFDFNSEGFIHFVSSYQKINVLNMSEIWAMPAIFKMLLIENVRRLSEQQVRRQKAVQHANQIADLQRKNANGQGLSTDAFFEAALDKQLPDSFLSYTSQLAKRLRGQDPSAEHLLTWLHSKLEQQNTTIDEIIQSVSLEQSITNETMSNIIGSLRLLGEINWKKIFEKVSYVEIQLRQHRNYPLNDFATRNMYRSNIERLAKGTLFTECEIAEKVVGYATEMSLLASNNIEKKRIGDPGYYLFGEKRQAFEKFIHYRSNFSEKIGYWFEANGPHFYVGLILVSSVSLVLLVFVLLNALSIAWPTSIFLIILLFFPITEVGAFFVNQAIVFFVRTKKIPGLSLNKGVPLKFRTLVAIPSLISNKACIDKLVQKIEVHYLSDISTNIDYALIIDSVDSLYETLPQDKCLLEHLQTSITSLNEKYANSEPSPNFFAFYRQRTFNEHEQTWMAWERKRGKLHELNRLLRGAKDTSFIPINSAEIKVPQNIKYVITLDEDTQLTRGAIKMLIGKMAHPLNQPLIDLNARRVIKGHAIMQPLITPSMPTNANSSWYQYIFSSPGGIDPYVSSSADVYQDMFDEGSYTGKGIYEIDAFEACLDKRIPNNQLLSHDLFEGIFARAGFASDIEVMEAFPQRYDSDMARLHRWTRGDWQLLPWLLGTVNFKQNIPFLGRWKIVDNLRRSLVQPCLLVCLFAAWFLPLTAGLTVTLLVIALIGTPFFVHLTQMLFSYRRSQGRILIHFKMWLADCAWSFINAALIVTFLPGKSLEICDAISRTLFRLLFTHDHLLQWISSSQSEINRHLTLSKYYRSMLSSVVLVLLMSSLGLLLQPSNYVLILAFMVLWCVAPIIAFLLSHSDARTYLHLHSENKKQLRLIGRRTWRYFDKFVTQNENMLPPDNYQQQPKAKIAHRTSPTNIGLYLLSVISARDFGWIGLQEAINRLTQTLDSIDKLEKFNGHLLNWYSTETLLALQPRYVSTVDSGNLAGHLIALANACEEWLISTDKRCLNDGLIDNFLLLKDELTQVLLDETHPAIHKCLQSLVLLSKEKKPLTAHSLKKIFNKLEDLKFKLAEAQIYSTDVDYWIDTSRDRIIQEQADRIFAGQRKQTEDTRLAELATRARTLANSMNFRFLFNWEKMLLSIGFSLDSNEKDKSCYDLLASEARLASLFAIAKNDVPTKHWWKLGRTATPVGFSAALFSWSGSMFEYLMPSLVIRAPFGSLIAHSNAMAVKQQISYAAKRGCPWGISESAYNARDMNYNYQYSNFGVPNLGLKRGLIEDLVISPYSSALASMIKPNRAVKNLKEIEKMGALGTYGFYEAIDFTAKRQPEGAKSTIIESFMAHHQGMTMVAINNALNNGLMRMRFHQEPMIASCDSLLQERIPRNISLKRPVVDWNNNINEDAFTIESEQSEQSPCNDEIKRTHILSNGQYSVMLSAAGGGYSRWGKISINRWQADSTCDNSGMFLFIKDVNTQKVWSALAQPSSGNTSDYLGEFAEDFARYEYSRDNLRTVMEVLVTPESNAEVRHLSLTNNSLLPKEIELTSYCELALSSDQLDRAHPAFSKMFIQTSFYQQYKALIATRRKRAPSDPDIWVATFAVVNNDVVSAFDYDTSRQNFLGRGNSIHTARAMQENRNVQTSSLTQTLGSVIDPVFALRYQIRIPVGGQVNIAYWMLAATSKRELLAQIDQHYHVQAFKRTKAMAWMQSQILLRHLGILKDEAATFQKLASAFLYLDDRFCDSFNQQGAKHLSKHLLWQESISGDRPIVVMHIKELLDIKQLEQLLRAHEYWKLKMLFVDLVIINDHQSSYFQHLQNAIEKTVRCSQSSIYQPNRVDNHESCYVYVLQIAHISENVLDMILFSARLVFNACDGNLINQCAHLMKRSTPNVEQRAIKKPRVSTTARLSNTNLTFDSESLDFFNGLGGFDTQQNEYVIILNEGARTPAPWVNIIANSKFGFQIAEDGNGYTWSENSRDNQLTPWHNDAVSNPCVEGLYVQDEDTLELMSASCSPIQDQGSYVIKHGFGYSKFSHNVSELSLVSTHIVALDDPIKLVRLTITNDSKKQKRLSITSYLDWVLGNSKAVSGPFLISDFNEEFEAICINNPWSSEFPSRVAFVMLQSNLTHWTSDRSEFLGRYGDTNHPKALFTKRDLNKRTGKGFDICSVLQQTIILAAQKSYELVVVIGQGQNQADALSLMRKYKSFDYEAVFISVRQYWSSLLGAVKVDTPDKATNIMLNGWLSYQTMSSRILARCGFYQASGAYGFRDQLQDGMAMEWHSPALVKEHIIRAAGRQFVEGDVQHWWLPQEGKGVRTHISDDKLWLVHAALHYSDSTADIALWHQPVSLLTGPELPLCAHDAFFEPTVSTEVLSVFAHCVLAINSSINERGVHGLPLIGTGDWNDGMNAVGKMGKGESVWLAWFLVSVIDRMLALEDPDLRHQLTPVRAKWKLVAQEIRESIDQSAWDGEWYRRAVFDDGTWLGSVTNDECKIDAICQSWSILANAENSKRANTAMNMASEYLIKPELGLALLFTPPFNHTKLEPGYIKGYPPGFRENGGQYTHAATWTIMALSKQQKIDEAFALFSMLNPINHALTPEATAQYCVEPYVVAADVYSVYPHTGRGGWTWYTGAAGSLYMAGISSLLGIEKRGKELHLTPNMPTKWSHYRVTLTLENACYAISISRTELGGHPIVYVDEVPSTVTTAPIIIPIENGDHEVRILITTGGKEV